MARSNGESVVTRALFAIEWSVIVAGALATVIVLAAGRGHRPTPRRDESAAALEARSACDGGTGTLATARAWLDGAELPAEPIAPEPALDASLRARGATLFASYCTSCHGAHADGKGELAQQLAIAPADLTTGVFSLRTTEHEALPTDLDLFRTITRGIHGTAMPPWTALPERDRWALVAYVKSISKAFSEDEAPAPIDTTSPAMTPARIDHGRQLFTTAGCASCHGAEAHGDGAAAVALTYGNGKPAKPRDLIGGGYHRASRSSDVYLTLTSGLDGTPMGSFANVLSSDDRWDLAMFVSGIAPPMLDQPGGLRCPRAPALSPNPDELVGVRSLLRSLPSTR